MESLIVTLRYQHEQTSTILSRFPLTIQPFANSQKLMEIILWAYHKELALIYAKHNTNGFFFLSFLVGKNNVFSSGWVFVAIFMRWCCDTMRFLIQHFNLMAFVNLLKCENRYHHIDTASLMGSYAHILTVCEINSFYVPIKLCAMQTVHAWKISSHGSCNSEPCFSIEICCYGNISRAC